MIGSLRLLLVLLVVLVAAGASASHYETWTTYYDCNLNAVGGSLLECNNRFTSWQQQSGVYKSVERYSCDGGSTPPADWYEWNGSSWVLLPDAPDPGC